MDPKYCYLEVGSYQGMSLIGAALCNKDKKCYGVENFAEEFRDNWENFNPMEVSNRLILHHNLKKYGKGNVFVFEEDYRRFFENRKDIDGKKVGVYFFDGPHTLAHQTAGLLFVRPLLADRAIIFVDDWNSPCVPQSVDYILSVDKRFKKIKHWIECYPRFREGVVALEYNKGL